MKLKFKLTISYIIISTLWVFSLYFLGNYFFQKQFQSYILQQQERKYEEIRQVVINAYSTDGTPPHKEFFIEYGDRLLEQNLILTVYDANDKEIFCISCLKEGVCNHALKTAEEMIKDVYPNFKGKYVEKRLVIEKNDKYLGYISIGYYGPFFFSESDQTFVKTFNNILIIIAILAFTISIALGVLSANNIAAPIRRVIKKTKDISDGDYTGKIELKNNTIEINELANSVNVLATNLNEQLKLKKQMASDFTHEFLTPLTILQNNIDAILDGVIEPTNDRLNSIKSEVQRLTRMVNDIEELVSLNNKNLKLCKTTFDIAETISSILNNFENEIINKNLKVIFKSKLIYLYASKDKISQVMINLISNAIKYSKKNGTITIKIKEENNGVIISVMDNGIGISKKDLPFIFEYLYRVDKSRNRNTGGSGIGLYVVKNIVDAHNGAIDVYSEINKGTSFIITLPNKK